MAKKALLYLALIISCICFTYFYVASLIFFSHLPPAGQTVVVPFSFVMILVLLGILKLFSIIKI